MMMNHFEESLLVMHILTGVASYVIYIHPILESKLRLRISYTRKVIVVVIVVGENL